MKSGCSLKRQPRVGGRKGLFKEVEAECIFDDKCSGMCLCSYDGLFLPPSRFRGWLRVI